MEKLQFDTGIREYEINGEGVLRFNPADPNLYNRFLDAVEEIRTIETGLTQQAQPAQEDPQADGERNLRLLKEADTRVKGLLSQVFGGENDFDLLLGGVNILAVAGNGERVITNLLEALFPILEQGAQSCVDGKVAQVKANRAARRAALR